MGRWALYSLELVHKGISFVKTADCDQFSYGHSHQLSSMSHPIHLSFDLQEARLPWGTDMRLCSYCLYQIHMHIKHHVLIWDALFCNLNCMLKLVFASVCFQKVIIRNQEIKYLTSFWFLLSRSAALRLTAWNKWDTLNYGHFTHKIWQKRKALFLCHTLRNTPTI